MYVIHAFKEYCDNFPEKILNFTCSAYPDIDKEHLKTELSLIYFRADSIYRAAPFLKLLIENKLSIRANSKKKRILGIRITIQMMTAEAENNFLL